MLSIIICSRHKILDKEFVDNIDATVGIDYELVSIDNSENSHSIFSAYNQGSQEVNFPIFVSFTKMFFFTARAGARKLLPIYKIKKPELWGWLVAVLCLVFLLHGQLCLPHPIT